MELNTSTVSTMDNLETQASPIQILYGTTTGNSEILGEETAEKLNEIGLPAVLSSTKDFNIDELYQIETLLLLMSTDDDGDPPMMAEGLYTFLSKKTQADFKHLSYSVLALGDSYYPGFCQAGKDFDHMLEKLGARRIAQRVDCDIRYWNDFEHWLANVCSVLGEKEKMLPYT